ncbi:NAD-dependent epimerase/dehydratase family protein [Vallicoccus soli]|uniref:NAD-dependent epimerase/dehydratase family protein n=1 Tax=Vallicoccus soli TaxID=2339232 RepID=A0A3A3Z448_9ACTN|nr:NAD-dependent epimerase/dehydratase family protein [Vallicoccus soli]RJK97698.1 NAD-dependent epimerase/dehydratase family protein [Vallicoccus soli]
MRVLLVGATGYVGSAVAERLAGAGHEVVALLRPGRDAPPPVGEVRRGDLRDPASLTAAVTGEVDAVVHAGAPTGDGAVDAAAVEALLAPLRTGGGTFVLTSGVWVLGGTGSATLDESAPVAPVALVRERPAVEQRVLAAAADGVRAVVLRPGVVHGRGGGIPRLLVDLARTHGAGRYVGAPVGWPMVHVDDLADLYAVALERATAGTVLHGVAEPSVPVVELADAAARAAGLGGGAAAWPLAEARAALGAPFADALALDQSVSAERTRRSLGWRPFRPGAVEDLRASYGVAAAA